MIHVVDLCLIFHVAYGLSVVTLFLPICMAVVGLVVNPHRDPGHQDLQSLEAESTDAVLLIATPGRLQSHVPLSIFGFCGDHIW